MLLYDRVRSTIMVTQLDRAIVGITGAKFGSYDSYTQYSQVVCSIKLCATVGETEIEKREKPTRFTKIEFE